VNADRAADIAVVGGGLAGLATAFFLRRLRPDVDLVILERGDAAGGKVRSTVHDGFTFDWGPNGFLDEAPETLMLCEALGLEDVLLGASSAAGDRFLVRESALVALPRSPAAFLRSPLVPAGGRLRALLEPLVPRWGGREESVASFLERRFGRGVADAFAESLVTGIAAGDPHALSVDALLPRLRDLERRHGSVLLGMIAAQRRARREGRRSRLSSLPGGMQRLIDALALNLGPSLSVSAPVVALKRRGDGYVVVVEGGSEVIARRVVLAVPAFVGAELLAPHLPEAAQLLAEIPYAPVVVVGLGYRQQDLGRSASGFGFLAPRGQGVRSLGVLWSSSLFPNQAPAGGVALRAIAGGMLDPSFLELSDSDAISVVQRDLGLAMGIEAAPQVTMVIRWRRGIPQYQLGHTERLRQVEMALSALPGVIMTGNAYRGVGINDVVRDACRIAEVLATD
jgi:oxygen-dependent protoporphyrinogen oxidase